MRETEVKYRVPYADTDRMGVVYYANYLIYFEILRNELLREAGLPYRELEAKGIMLPVIESHCDYKSPVRYDDLISIRGRIEEVKGPRIKIFCEVYLEDRLAASGYTVHACVNSSGRPIRPPEELRQICEPR